MTIDHTTAASQLALVSRSADRLDRARAYAGRLAAHTAEVRAKLDAAAGDATAGPLRGELIEVEAQHRQAARILAEVEAEHARHDADLRALYRSDGGARARLAEAQDGRALAQAAADAVKVVLDRAAAHARGVEGRLTAARASEAQHDADAAARLHAALRDGAETPAATDPLVRASAGLEDDARAANAAEARAAAEYRAALSTLAAAERLICAAADAVLTADADAMACEVQALDARATLLRGRLAAYAARVPGDYVARSVPVGPAKQHPGGWLYRDPPAMAATPRLPQTPAIAAALAVPFNTMATKAPPAEAAAWTAYADALRRDAEATAGFPEAAAPIREPTMADLSVAPVLAAPARLTAA